MNNNETHQQAQQENKQTGKVKWFNPAKGFGFIVSDSGSEDLFAHFSQIMMEGYKTLQANQSVSFAVKPSDKGFHAIDITPLDMIEVKS